MKLLQGDCLELMKTIPDKSIDMILTDPPYGTTSCKWDSVIPFEPMWEQLNRIIKDNGAIVLTSQGIFTARLILSNEEWFKYKIVWIKSKSTNFLNAKKQPLRKHEDICVFYKKQPTYNPQMTPGESYDKGIRKDQFTGSYGDFKPCHVKSDGKRYPNDVVFYDEDDFDDCVYFKTAESEGPVYHPTQKPVSLLEYLIKTYTLKNETVLDFTMGSGSTGVACVNTNRNFIGIELDDKYFVIAKNRIESAIKDKESMLFPEVV